MCAKWGEGHMVGSNDCEMKESVNIKGKLIEDREDEELFKS